MKIISYIFATTFFLGIHSNPSFARDSYADWISTQSEAKKQQLKTQFEDLLTETRKQIKDADQLILEQPKNQGLYDTRARMLTAAISIQQSISIIDKLKLYDDYTKLIQFEPNNATNYSLRAIAEIGLKDYSNAIKDLDFFIEHSKNAPQSSTQTLYTTNSPTEQKLEVAFGKLHTSLLTFAYLQRAYCKRQLGDDAGNNADLKSAKRLQPDLDINITRLLDIEY